jgi:hypothetical protein
VSAALDVALAYHEAWSSKDFERAMTYIADDIAAAFGDEDTAIVLYDTDTIPVKHAPGAEHVTVANGKIVHSHFVFDRLPFRTAA